MRKFFTCIVAVTVVLIYSSITMAQDSVNSEKFSLYYVSRNQTCSQERFLVENEPPLVKHVDLMPVSPGPDDDIRVAVKVENNPLFTRSRPLIVQLHYSIDGGRNWTVIEMDDLRDDMTMWEGVIPALGEAGEIDYFFTSEDDSGNLLIEVPALEMEWGSADGMAMTGYLEDEDDDFRMVKDDLDILQARVGYDGESLYFGMKVQGRISSGTVTPFEISIYSVGIYYPDEINDGSFRSDLVLEHSQHAQFVMFPVVGLLDVERKLSEVLAADARYYTDDDWLYLRFNTKVLDNKDFDYLRIIMGTATAVDYTPLVAKPIDTTSFINLVKSDRKIIIN
ncbi:MAG TPA: hypothetical protein PLN69_11625 [bacterium]|nr:hypothetical protein [bacterium]